MRLLPLYMLLGATALARAAGVADPLLENEEEEEDDEYQKPVMTVFNHQEVPPMFELTPENYDLEVATHKYMLVKHYSPYCHHCQAYAPAFQTTYEYYWTTKSFTETYDFKFAMINCVAYFDLCAKKKVTSYPLTMLYKNGELANNIKGVKNVTYLSNAIEEILSADFPDTRPAQLALPEAGDAESPDYKAGSQEVLNNPASEDKTTDSQDSKIDSSKPVLVVSDPIKSNDVSKPASNAVAVISPSKPAGPLPNRNGLSVSLDAMSFANQVVATREPWFIKFYAPWCHHCQAMAPNWMQLAKNMKDRLNVGEVNCEKESHLCSDIKLDGYPTMLFFQGGQRVEYDGLRGLGDLTQYAERALEASTGVPDLDLAAFEKLEEKEDVIFVYFYDFATTKEDMEALNRLPLSLINRARVVKTNDPAMYKRFKVTTWPRLVVSREGHPTYYTPLTPGEMRDVRSMLNWMKSVWLPIMPELTASNAREIMDGKIVVLGVLNREDQESFIGAVREMKSAANEWMEKQIQLFQLERQELRDAKQLRIEEAEDRDDQRALRNAKNIRISMDMSSRKQVTFAWVDIIFWQRWLRTTYGIDIKNGDRVIINDEDNRRYWDTTITGNNIVPSRTSILETITKVTASPPLISPKYTVGNVQKIFYQLKVTFGEHPYLSALAIIASFIGMVSWYRGRGHSLAGRARSMSLAAEVGKARSEGSGLLGSAMGGGSETVGGKQD
ncbi:Thioredoxin domain-containing protein [Ceratocystis fimbriata CBS 114723]|uniref:Thioredoxin domain-containing protein n=1 Tax=Ceratocystis fimbriata CBS 114723 TaxID=1035309 RepID=A0A2C5XD58_9PEZI|nr:Thioredoxin domain-containing protein [Ceratocystis fimbriata CBS 114723]